MFYNFIIELCDEMNGRWVSIVMYIKHDWVLFSMDEQSIYIKIIIVWKIVHSMQTNEILCIPHTHSFIYRHILLLIMVLNNCFHNYYNYDCDLLDQINFVVNIWCFFFFQMKLAKFSSQCNYESFSHIIFSIKLITFGVS